MNKILKSAISTVSLSEIVKLKPQLSKEERKFYRRKILKKIQKINKKKKTLKKELTKEQQKINLLKEQIKVIQKNWGIDRK